MQRCQIWYLGSKAHTLFSIKWQRCSSHFQQFDAFFSAHSARKLKETVFLHVRAQTYIINSYSVNCFYVSLSLARTLPLACAHSIRHDRLPAPTRQYATFKDCDGYLFHGYLYRPFKYSHKGEPRQYRKRTRQNADGNSKKRLFYLLARTTTFISEQNRTATKAHMVLRHTCGHTGGAFLFWVVTRHWFVVGYRCFGMVSSAA